MLHDALLNEAIVLLIKILFQSVGAQLGHVAVDRGARLHLGVGLVAGRTVHASGLEVGSLGRVPVLDRIADDAPIIGRSIILIV